MKVTRRDKSRVYKHIGDNQVTVESNLFQNFTHSVTDHALRLSPLQIHSLQTWERWGIIPSLLTASTHMLRARAPMAARQEAESSLLFP